MDVLIDLLTSYGYAGMLISAFLAGSFLPFSSEAVILGLLAAGLHPWTLILYATVGNMAGGMFNYGVGRMGNLVWIEKYLRVSQQSLARAERFMAGHGAWMGFFAFLPIIGSAITIMLGLMRANVLISMVSMTAGKFLRYLLLVYSVAQLF
ncbi:MAG: YqaA family protein [Hoylesella marshii]|uniref:YqaA family protein n=1 Tax=Hoylesella marshii TaxID=189722 RepID=UPI003FA0E1F8